MLLVFSKFHKSNSGNVSWGKYLSRRLNIRVLRVKLGFGVKWSLGGLKYLSRSLNISVLRVKLGFGVKWGLGVY